MSLNLSSVLLIAAAIPSIVLHEVSHGWVANKFGDPTAKNAGRLTLNPIKHIDPFGTILMPVLMALAHLPAFGYAKPVPVNVNRLRKPRNQSVYVSLAGPLTNVILSALAWVVCETMYSSNPNIFLSSNHFFEFFLYLGIVNMILAVFNMLPIPPFDGSALVERLVPRKHLGAYFRLRAQALPFAFLFVLLIFWVLPIGSRIFADLQGWWISSLF